MPDPTTSPVSEQIVERVARALVPITQGSQEDVCGAALPDMQFDDLTPDWQSRYCDYARAAIEASGLVECVTALSKCLAREAEWAKLRGLSDCTCITLSRDGEREYETGNCPHQIARAALSNIQPSGEGEVEP